MKPEMPKGFIEVGRNFQNGFIDSFESEEEIPVIALNAIARDDLPALRSYLDHVLEQGYSFEDLKKIWDATGAAIYFTDRKGLLYVLKMIRETIDDYDAALVAVEQGSEIPDNAYVRNLNAMNARVEEE